MFADSTPIYAIRIEDIQFHEHTGNWDVAMATRRQCMFVHYTHRSSLSFAEQIVTYCSACMCSVFSPYRLTHRVHETVYCLLGMNYYMFAIGLLSFAFKYSYS